MKDSQLVEELYRGLCEISQILQDHGPKPIWVKTIDIVVENSIEVYEKEQASRVASKLSERLKGGQDG